MDIQENKFVNRFKSTFVYDLLSQTLTDEELFEHVIDANGEIIWFKDQMRQMWFMWQAAKASAPEGFVLVKRDFTNAAAYAAKSVDGRLSAFKYGDVWNVMIEAQEPSNDS